LDAFSINLVIRDFLREAVFFLIIPALADLSKISYTFGNKSFASFIFFWATKSRASFTVAFILVR